VPFIKENGEMDKEMVRELRHGQMDQNMRVCGKTIKQTDMGNFYMPMVTYMKVCGTMIKLMVKESIFTPMVQPMKETGKKINSMDSEKKAGLMELSTKAIILKGRSMAKEF
jgi:hypothetical protein